MAPYVSNGSLTTGKRTINDEDGWDSQAEWEAYQSKSNVNVVSGTLELAEGASFPDPILTAYEYEDDSTTGTAIDSLSGNDSTISGATYTTNAAVGANALYHDGSAHTESNNATDLAALGGDGFGLGGWVNPDNLNRGVAMAWHVDSDNWFLVRIDSNTSWSAWLRVGGNNETINNVESAAADTYTHLWGNVTTGQVELWSDGSLITAQSHSLGIGSMGSGTYITGYRKDVSDFQFTGEIDDFAVAGSTLTETQINELVNR